MGFGDVKQEKKKPVVKVPTVDVITPSDNKSNQKLIQLIEDLAESNKQLEERIAVLTSDLAITKMNMKLNKPFDVLKFKTYLRTIKSDEFPEELKKAAKYAEGIVKKNYLVVVDHIFFFRTFQLPSYLRIPLGHLVYKKFFIFLC